MGVLICYFAAWLIQALTMLWYNLPSVGVTLSEHLSFFRSAHTHSSIVIVVY